MEVELKRKIMIPLYGLLYLDELSEDELLADSRVEYFTSTYSRETLREIVELLAWTEENRFDFREIAPFLKLKSSVIQSYFNRLRTKLESFLAKK